MGLPMTDKSFKLKLEHRVEMVGGAVVRMFGLMEKHHRNVKPEYIIKLRDHLIKLIDARAKSALDELERQKPPDFKLGKMLDGNL